MKTLMLSLLTMFAIPLLFPQAIKAQAKNNSSLKPFVEYISTNVKYPQNALESGVEYVSLITFNVKGGRMKDVKVNGILDECDKEVLAVFKSYGQFEDFRNGKYALKTTFRLGGSVPGDFANAETDVPEDHYLLKILITASQKKTNKS